MTAPHCACPSCHLIFSPTAPGPQVVCPVCDTRFSPGAAAVAPPAPATSPGRGWPAGIAVVVLLLLAAGIGLAVWRPGPVPAPQVAARPAPAAERPSQPPSPDTPAAADLLAPVPDLPLPALPSLPPAPAAGGPPPTAPKRPPAPAPKLPPTPALARPIIQAVSRSLSDKINRAIDCGQAYLQRQGDKIGHNVRYEYLLGLTLLECGVPRNDPLVLRIAESLRAQANRLCGTYELSTAIFFLDRLGDRADDVLIRTFAERLAAGQYEGGTWTYSCPLLTPSTPPLLQGAKGTPARRNGRGDHSNTQFATLALWVSRRHGAGPEIRMALVRVERHFRGTQAEDGSWSYHPGVAKAAGPLPGPSAGPPGGVESPQVVSQKQWKPFSNLGFAGDGRQSWSGFDAGKINPFGPRFPAPGQPHDPRANQRPKVPGPQGVWRTTGSCAGLLALAVGHALDGRANPRPLNDPAVTAALRYLGTAIAAVPYSPPPEVRSGPQLDGRDDAYTLWSVERVGTLFGLQRLGDRPWYPWAAEWLVATQRRDGSWQHNLGPIVNTCFALLVLRRSNLAPDLTYALSNPGKRPAATPRPLKQGLPSDTRAQRRPQTPTAPSTGLPVSNPPRSVLQAAPQNADTARQAHNPKTP